MHFRTSDLLFVTAIAAMYATGYAYAPIQAFKPIDFIWVLMPLTQAPLVFKARRSLRRAGPAVCRWTNRGIRWAHLMFATIFLISCVATSGTVIDITLGAGAMMLMHHVMFTQFASVTVGSEGATIGPTLLLRETHAFEFDEANRRLAYRRRSGAKSAGFLQPHSGHLPVPGEHAEAVAAWTADEKEKNHGSHE